MDTVHTPPQHTHTHTHTQLGKGQNPQNAQSVKHDTNPDPAKTPAEGDNPDTKPKLCAILEKKPLKMEQFFASLKTISPLSLKHTPDTDAALDGKLMDFKIFQSSIGLFIFRLKLVSQKSHFFNKVLELGS